MLLSPQDHEKVRAAVEAAERKTSGEIVAVIARECSDYWEVPLVWGIAAALILPAGLLLAGVYPGLLARLGAGWTIAHASAVESSVFHALTISALIQAALFVIVTLAVSIPPVRRALTPRGLKHERVRRRAEEQFAVQGLHLSEGRTGVLIFAALAERRAEIIAEKKVFAEAPKEAWAEILKPLLAGMRAGDPGEGFAGAIARAGELLALHAPRRPGDTNELPDTVIELEH